MPSTPIRFVIQPRKVKKSPCCSWKSCFSLSDSTYILADEDAYSISFSQTDASLHEDPQEVLIPKTEITRVDLSKYKPPTNTCRTCRHLHPARKRRISIIGDMDCDLRVWCVTREVSRRILDEYINLKKFAEYTDTYKFPIKLYRFCPLFITVDSDEVNEVETLDLEDLPEQTLRKMGMFPLLRQFTPTAPELAFRRRRAWMSLEPRAVHRRWSLDLISETSVDKKKPRTVDKDFKDAEKAIEKHYRNEAIKVRRQAQLKYWHEYVEFMRASRQRDLEVTDIESETFGLNPYQCCFPKGRFLLSGIPIFVPHPLLKRRISVTGAMKYDSSIVKEYEPTNEDYAHEQCCFDDTDSDSSLDEADTEDSLFIDECHYVLKR